MLHSRKEVHRTASDISRLSGGDARLAHEAQGAAADVDRRKACAERQECGRDRAAGFRAAGTSTTRWLRPCSTGLSLQRMRTRVTQLIKH